MPEWAVLKNHARLPVVTGDIDLCVPPSRWDAFLDAYLSALASAGSYAVVVCDHHSGVRVTLAVPLDTRVDHVLQIDLMDGIRWKGTLLLSAADMLANCMRDMRGFRRMPAGVEAAHQLTSEAIRRGGGLASDRIAAKAIRQKALADPVTFDRTMLVLHGRPGGWAARRFITNEWQCWVGLLLTSRRMLRALRHPLTRSVTFARRKAQAHWRGVPRRVDGSSVAWLQRVSRGHRVHVVGPADAGLNSNADVSG